MMELAEFSAYLISKKRYSKHTETAYINDCKQFFAFCTQLDAKDEKSESPDSTIRLQFLTKNNLRKWIYYLSESKVIPKSINRKLSSVKALGLWLLKQEVPIEEDFFEVTSLKLEERLPIYLEESEIERLFLDDSLLPVKNFKEVRDKLILSLFYSTGIRLSELINLKTRDIDYIQLRIKVLGKGNKERFIPITSDLVVWIKNYLLMRTSNFSEENIYLVVTDKNLKSYPIFVHRIVKKLLSLISSHTKLSSHKVRHTFATHLLNRGADLTAIKELLGHSSLSATQVYTHNSIEELKKQYHQAHPKSI